ncbi:MAG: hypothetical protein H6739_13270 [Alphaproteobacteria bacterium]|nr:hypothetical protein [Alphaproteobacteria bacterium]
MKTGEVVRDAQGNTYKVGPLLGRGLWGKSYLCRHGDNDAEVVLKVPLGRPDFKGDTPVPDRLLDQLRRAGAEQAALLKPETYGFLPPPGAPGPLEDETPLLVLPRYTTTLDRRINQGCTLSEALGVLVKVLEHLKALGAGHGSHGNLRPSNILLNDRGDVFLSDVATPALTAALPALAERGPGLPATLAPEIARGGAPSPAADTYAVGMMLYQAVLTPRDGDADGRLGLRLPRKGLDKGALVALKDRVVERLKQEDSNPRFHARLAERLAAVVNRAISEQTSPSPPFRFLRPDDMLPRLDEVRALIRPEVTSVGKVMLSRPPANQVFETGEEVAFSATVAASAGVESHEEIACGIALYDAESNERLRDVDCAYTVDRHPSGRFRFAFKLGGVGPGRYVCRVAFLIRDSGHQPVTAEAEFEVRAAAGYVPPIQPHGPAALPFDRGGDEAETAVTRADGLFEPTPIAPPKPAAADDSDTLNHLIDPSETLANLLDQVAEEAGVPLRPPAVSLGTPSISIGEPGLPAASTSEDPERTEPMVSVTSKVPQADPLSDIVGAGSWTDLPLPNTPDDELSAPDLDDIPEPAGPNPLQRLIDTIRGDTYLLYMTIAGVSIIALSILLFLLDR